MGARPVGGTSENIEQARIVDLNCDRHDELLRVLADRLISRSVHEDRL